MTEFALARYGCPPSDGSGMQRRRPPARTCRLAPHRSGSRATSARPLRAARGGIRRTLAPASMLSTQAAAVPSPRRRPNSAAHALYGASPAATFRRGLASARCLAKHEAIPRPSPIRAPARTAARPPRRAFRRRRAPLPRQARSAQRQAHGLRRRRTRPTGAARSGSAVPGMPGLVAGRGALPCVAGLHSRRPAGFGPPPETSPWGPRMPPARRPCRCAPLATVCMAPSPRGGRSARTSRRRAAAPPRRPLSCRIQRTWTLLHPAPFHTSPAPRGPAAAANRRNPAPACGGSVSTTSSGPE